MTKITLYIAMALILLQACTPGGIKAVDDFIEGEAKVIENVISDEAGIPQKQ